jgi:hypothetical protein
MTRYEMRKRAERAECLAWAFGLALAFAVVFGAFVVGVKVGEQKGAEVGAAVGLPEQGDAVGVRAGTGRGRRARLRKGRFAADRRPLFGRHFAVCLRRTQRLQAADRHGLGRRGDFLFRRGRHHGGQHQQHQKHAEAKPEKAFFHPPVSPFPCDSRKRGHTPWRFRPAPKRKYCIIIAFPPQIVNLNFSLVIPRKLW